MIADIREYYTEDIYTESPYIGVLKGEVGSGKTAFAKHLIDDLNQISEFETYLLRNNGQLPIFSSVVNPETQLHFLNAWKPII